MYSIRLCIQKTHNTEEDVCLLLFFLLLSFFLIALV